MATTHWFSSGHFSDKISSLAIWQKNSFQNLFSKRSNYTCDNFLTFLDIACPEYHFVQSDVVVIRFLKYIVIMGIMRKLKYSLSRNALNQMYMSYMLPIVEYASVVCDRCSEQDSVTLQKVQNEVARLVTGLTRSVSLKNLFKECGWATLSQRRQQHKLIFMYNVNIGIVPSYIQILIPPLVGEVSNDPLRNTWNITVPYNQTSILQKILYFIIH